MRLGTIDGSAFSFMTGIGEAYFAAFVLAIGLGELTAGLIGPLPQLMAACAMLFVHGLILRLGSLKKWVVLLAAVQSIIYAPLTAIAVIGAAPGWLIFVLVAIYWTGSIGGGAAWNAWAAAIYPAPIRPRYFGWRTRLQQLFVLVGLVTGGLILQTTGSGHDTGTGQPDGTIVYAILFALAGIARGLSTLMLSRHSDPVPIPKGFRDVTLPEFAKGLRNHRGGKLLLAMLTLQGAAMVSGPFFAPYMLAQLEFSYAQFTFLLGTTVLTKSFALPYIGELIKKAGARRVLIIGGFGVAFSSVVWVVSDNFWYLIICQVYAGVFWAMYELSSFLLLFDTIPPRERVGLLARFNLINTLASSIGAAIGAALLSALGTGAFAYLVVFAASSALRLCVAPLLLRVERVEPITTDLPLRPISVGAGAASMNRPVLAGLDDQLDDQPDGQAGSSDRYAMRPSELPEADPVLGAGHTG